MGVVVDSSVLVDALSTDSPWLDWAEAAISAAASRTRLVINEIIYAEVSVGFATVEAVDAALAPDVFLREAIPYEAAFVAGKAFHAYRRRGGLGRSPLPDFFIGAHAAVAGHELLTRDAVRIRTYFPTVTVISPQ